MPWGESTRNWDVSGNSLLYEWAPFPAGRSQRSVISSAAGRLREKLCRLDLDVLEISEYSKRYLGNYLRDLRGTLRLLTFLLGLGLNGRQDLGDLVVVDYGGGTGLFSALAREVGVGTVVYQDIYDVSCRDAEVIGRALGSQADHYLTGDIEELLRFFDTTHLGCDVVVSFDVIEHVHDPEAFFSALTGLPGPELVLVMASSANGANPRIMNKLRDFHELVEHTDRERRWGCKERDALESYLSIRRRIVEDACRTRGVAADPSITGELASLTRGMMEPAIRRAVDEFIDSGRIPRSPSHATNTCDPYTGNWAEHVLDPHSLAAVLQGNGFSAQVTPGYFNDTGRRRLRTVPLNAVISLSNSHGLRFAPYYVVAGARSA